jgi:hypothetical protein
MEQDHQQRPDCWKGKRQLAARCLASGPSRPTEADAVMYKRKGVDHRASYKSQLGMRAEVTSQAGPAVVRQCKDAQHTCRPTRSQLNLHCECWRASTKCISGIDMALTSKAVTSLRPLLARSFASALDAPVPSQRKSWRREEIQQLYDAPLMDLIFRAATVHRQFHDPSKIQLCTLLNIKCA